MVAVSYGATEYLFHDEWADSAMKAKGYEVWENFYCDTLSFDTRILDTIIDLGSPGYNIHMRSLLATAESCYAHVAFDTYKSFFYDDSIARNLLWHTVGITAGVGNQDWFVAPVKAQYIYIRPDYPAADAGVDSIITLELRFVR